MIKVVTRPFLGKEKYKDFRLCYVDTIPETVCDLTPESKAWKKTPEYRAIKKRLKEEVKQGLRNSIYDWDSPLMYRIQCFDAPNPNYHKGKAELEKKLFGAKDSSPIDLSNEYYKRTGIRDLYESYESRVGTVECLGSAICRFTDAFWAHVNNEDMRVVFQVW